MKTSIEGLAEIASHEGVCLAPYLDSVGVWTIGIGHTAAAGPPDPQELRGRELTLKSAFELFSIDIKKYEKRVNDAVKVPLKQWEFDALVSFDYNTGGIFKANLTKKLNEGDRGAAAEAFMGWSKPKAIIPRRKREQRLFITGKYSAGGKATVYPVDAKGTPLFSQGRALDVLAILKEGPPAGAITEGLGIPEREETPPAGRRGARKGIVGIVALGSLLLGVFWRPLLRGFKSVHWKVQMGVVLAAIVGVVVLLVVV